MDQGLVAKAVAKAIAAGCQSPTAIPQFGADTNFVRVQTDVGGGPDVFKTYFEEIAQDADIAKFGTYFSAGPNGGVSIGVDQVGKLLLAQCLVTGDIPGTVAKLARHAASNESLALAVMAVDGVKIAAPIQLGPVKLVPLTEVPPSSQRGMALAQDHFGIGPKFALPAAFVTEYRHKPSYYVPEEPQPREDITSQSANNAFETLDEARTLLAVLGSCPAIRMMWSQPMDWIEAGGLGSGWQTAPGGDWAFNREFDAKAAEATANEYFAIPPSDRTKVLRVPLDRLNKALAERDFTDRVIDLGIGLEALLLHNLPDDRGELSFRFSLHGAWLLGKDEAGRNDIRKALRAMYQLRSKAVHVGYIEFNADNETVFKRAIGLCQELIRTMIGRKCKVDWSLLVMGGN